MKTICVRNIEIGTGKPKIAASITAGTHNEILHQANTMRTLPVDLVEWRMDHFFAVNDNCALQDCLTALRDALGTLPLIATFRSEREGGQQHLSAENYAALNESIISSGKIDLLDVEFYTGETIVSHLLEKAHAAGIPVILSNHDFEKTPSKEEMIDRLCHMQELGGDILKLAVMPHSRSDVLTLLSATEEMYSYYADRPLVTMSMGEFGAISRFCGQYFGSAITFGAASTASAPGQIKVDTLSALLSSIEPFCAEPQPL